MDKGIAERAIPYDNGAEMSVLGALLIDGEAIHRALPVIRAEDFHRARHNYIYAAVSAIAGRGGSIDQVTVARDLAQRDRLDAVGGLPYLGQLVANTPTSVNVEHYAGIVADLAAKRRIIDAGRRIAELGFSDDDDADAVLRQCQDVLHAIRPASANRGFVHIAGVLDAYLQGDGLEGIAPGQEAALPTGYGDLDELIGGLSRSDLIILGARPSMGKSSLALNMCVTAAAMGQVCGVFSLEMSREQVARRLLIAETGIDSQRLRTGLINEREETAITDAVGRLSDLPIYIDDSAVQTPAEMRARSLRLQAEAGLDLLVVDYLQLISAPGRRRGGYENRVQEITEISRSLKSLARDLNAPALTLSQLSRAVEQRPVHRPQLSDLRDSGSIEQDADIVMFLYREDKNFTEDEWATARPGQPYPRHIVEVAVAKHRNGPTGALHLYFKESAMQFVNLPTRPMRETA